MSTAQFILFEGLGERHDLQGPGRLQQAAALRAQRNAEGRPGGKVSQMGRMARWESQMGKHICMEGGPGQVGNELESEV